VRSDVLDGFTTIELAERDYGVVIDADTVTVDAEATERRRADMRSAVTA
jgi:5-oxoprolinase (ATP-hydrolysing)